MISDYMRSGAGYIKGIAAAAGLALLVAGASNAIAQDYRETPIDGLPGLGRELQIPKGGLPGLGRELQIPKGDLPGFGKPSSVPKQDNYPGDSLVNKFKCAAVSSYVKKHGDKMASTYELELETKESSYRLKLILSNDDPHDEKSSLEMYVNNGGKYKDVACDGNIKKSEEQKEYWTHIINIWNHILRLNKLETMPIPIDSSVKKHLA